MAVRLADPLQAVQSIVDKLPDVPATALGLRTEDDPLEMVAIQSDGGPRQRGYSSKSRMQLQVVCYAPNATQAWVMSEAIYSRLNAIATEQVDYADKDAIGDPPVPNRHICLLSIIAASSPTQSKLGDEPPVACQSTYTVLYDAREKT